MEDRIEQRIKKGEEGIEQRIKDRGPRTADRGAPNSEQNLDVSPLLPRHTRRTPEAGTPKFK